MEDRRWKREATALHPTPDPLYPLMNLLGKTGEERRERGGKDGRWKREATALHRTPDPLYALKKNVRNSV